MTLLLHWEVMYHMISVFFMTWWLMSGSLDLNTLDQVTNKDPLAGLDPTVTSFVHPAMTCGYLFETLRTFHNVPGQGTSASAAATATSGLYFASAMDVSSDGSEKSSSQGSKRIGRRVTSQRSQGMARKTLRASQASKTSRRCCKARQTNPRPRGRLTKIVTMRKPLRETSKMLTASPWMTWYLAKCQCAGGSRSKVWFGVWKVQLNLPSIDEVVLADDHEHGPVLRNIWHAGMDSRPVLTIVLKY